MMGHEIYRHKRAIILGMLLFSVMALSGTTTGCASLDDKNTGEGTLQIHLFYGEDCENCLKEQIFLRQAAENEANLNVIEHDIAKENKLWEDMKSQHDVNASSIPMTFIAGKVFVDFIDSGGEERYYQNINAYKGYQNQISEEIQKNLEG